jgi:hypothetical protein
MDRDVVGWIICFVAEGIWGFITLLPVEQAVICIHMLTRCQKMAQGDDVEGEEKSGDHTQSACIMVMRMQSRLRV